MNVYSYDHHNNYFRNLNIWVELILREPRPTNKAFAVVPCSRCQICVYINTSQHSQVACSFYQITQCLYHRCCMWKYVYEFYMHLSVWSLYFGVTPHPYIIELCSLFKFLVFLPLLFSSSCSCSCLFSVCVEVGARFSGWPGALHALTNLWSNSKRLED